MTESGAAVPEVVHENFSEGLPVTPEFVARWRETRERRELSRSLVEMRLEAGLTQTQVAARMNKDQAFVSRMESATGPTPKAAHISLYAGACGYVTGYAFLKQSDDAGVTLHGLHSIGQDADVATLLSAVHDVPLATDG